MLDFLLLQECSHEPYSNIERKQYAYSYWQLVDKAIFISQRVFLSIGHPFHEPTSQSFHKNNKLENVDMAGDLAESEGIVCGGTMEVLIETN
jgi:hypothetical protein